MKNWTIGKRIVANSAVLLAILLALGLFTFKQLKNIDRYKETIVVDCLPGIALIGDIDQKASENYILTLRMVQTDDKEVEKRFAATIQTNVLIINDLTNRYEKTITMEEDRQLFGKFITARAGYVTSFKEVVALSEASKDTEARALVDSKLQPAYETFMGSIDDLIKFNKKNGEEAGAGITQASASANRGLWIGLGVALLTGVLVAGFVIVTTTRVLRNVVTSLNEGADQVASASGQVASASQTLAEGASEQAASLEETSASLEEMTSMVKRNADSAQQAKEISSQTRAAADTGARDMDQMQHSMAAIKTSSDEIAKIVKNIDEIAFQTNILALNAAVEAARAGEAGAGFAVVADEVRNLAQRSANAAKETANKIEDAIAKTTQGVEVSGKVAESLKQIIEKARTVDDLVGEIASASKEQSQGIQQVNTAVTQMDKVTQSNAASAEESASASEELSSQAQAVKDSVETLQALVGGSTRSRGSVRHEEVSHQPAPARKRASFNAAPRASTQGGNGHSTGRPSTTTTVVKNGRHTADLPMPEESEFKNF